jgi:hypothetical protein
MKVAAKNKIKRPFLEKGVRFQRLGTTTSNLSTVISLIAN